MDERPIGVFDSGVGGLTVLHECLVTLPHEDFVYLGDGARLPYGPRPLDEIRRFATEIAGFLEAQGVKLIVAACNSATAAALPDLQRQLSVPVVGVLAPEAHAAVLATRNRRIGLLATEATVASGRYAELVRALDAGAEFLPVACPRLVPLIEGDDPFGEETTASVREYAVPLKEAGVDTVVLGCTHYPLIEPIFQRVFGRGVTLVFSAEEVAREVAETLARKGVENADSRDMTKALRQSVGESDFVAHLQGSIFAAILLDGREHSAAEKAEGMVAVIGSCIPNELAATCYPVVSFTGYQGELEVRDYLRRAQRDLVGARAHYPASAIPVRQGQRAIAA